MSDLFEASFQNRLKTQAPLYERLRPQSLQNYIGQAHLLKDGAPLKILIEQDKIPSMILWGPPGVGKTSLALLIAHLTQSRFHSFSAVLFGIKEVRVIVEQAETDLKYHGKKTILFVDEIHRFNKAQQDAFLPHLEKGTLILIGATTENPSFEVIGPLLSRTQVFTLKPLTEQDLRQLLQRALIDSQGLKIDDLSIEKTAEDFLIQFADGDARRLLNALEVSAALVSMQNSSTEKSKPVITLETVQNALQTKTLLYDQKGEEHYNLISALIKSMRASDADAAIYWLARMLEAGEAPLFIARRLVIFASEDIGNADPQALPLAMAAMQAFDFVGMPEGWVPLAQAVTYLACAPKSKASYYAYLQAKADVEKHGSLPTPLHLRNAVTPLMKELGYGRKEVAQETPPACLPEELKGKIYYKRPS